MPGPENTLTNAVTPEEETRIREWATSAGARGHFIQKKNIKEMADLILQDRASDPKPTVSAEWVEKFVKETPEFEKLFQTTASYHNAKSGDATAARRWFDIVQKCREEYKIYDCDFYNAGKMANPMGTLGLEYITGCDIVQKGDIIHRRAAEWLTTFECISLEGKSFPPGYVAKREIAHDKETEEFREGGNWFGFTEDGWSTPEVELNWIKEHWNPLSASCMKGTYRLLILGDCASTGSLALDKFCMANKIVTVSTPIKSSHTLQPIEETFRIIGRNIKKLRG